MAYLPRFDAPGAVHHVYARGAGPSVVFATPEDYACFFAIAASTFVRLGWVCLQYCLLTSHYHLLVRTAGADLSAGMQRINSLYARTFNCRHERHGHLFGERFGSTFVQTQKHLLTVVRYVALNPVEASVCEHPDAWPWSSYGSAARGEDDPVADNAELLRLVGGAERLRFLVEATPFTVSETVTLTSSETVEGAPAAAPVAALAG